MVSRFTAFSFSLMLVSSLALAQTPAARQSAQKQIAPAAASESKTDALKVQILLAKSGFSPGEIDGLAGANLKKTLTAFQQAHQLPATGDADAATLQALGG